MKVFWKKTGWVFMVFLPIVVSLIGQIVMGVAVIIIHAMAVAGRMALSGNIDTEQLQSEISSGAMDVLPIGILIYHILAILIFGLWYYFGCGRPKAQAPARVFSGKCIPVTALMGFFMCISANAMVLTAQYVVPTLIDEYMEMAESAGLGTNVFAIIASVLVAPVGEEILCRGLNFYYAGKVVEGMKNRKTAFWIANSLQAFAFAVMHGNLVQGTYAFVLGLALGWLRVRYNSLYPAMLAHLIVNFTSTFLVEYLFIPIPESFVVYLLLTVVSLAAIVGTGWWDSREKAPSAS